MDNPSEKINFNYSPFDEDIVVIGGKSRGKSTIVKKILIMLSALNYWIYDFNWQYTGFGQTVHDLKDLQVRGQFVFQPKNKEFATFIAFCQRAFTLSQYEPNLVLVFEELHQYVTKQKTIPELYSVVMSGRNYGLSSIFVSTTTTALPNWILTNAQHCFAFSTANESAIKWLEGYIGAKAWLLVPQDKRIKAHLPDTIRNYPNLTKHSYLYRNQTDDDSQIVVCTCTQCQTERS